MPAATADFYGIRNLGVNYGLVFTAFGVAGVVGPLLGAQIRDHFGSYLHAYQISAAMLVLGALLALVTKPPGTAPRRRPIPIFRPTNLPNNNQQPKSMISNPIIDSIGPGRIAGRRARAQSLMSTNATRRPAPSELEQTIQDIKNPVSWLSWGGDLRLRNEYFNNALSLGVPDGWHRFWQRA